MALPLSLPVAVVLERGMNLRCRVFAPFVQRPRDFEGLLRHIMSALMTYNATGECCDGWDYTQMDLANNDRSHHSLTDILYIV